MNPYRRYILPRIRSYMHIGTRSIINENECGRKPYSKQPRIVDKTLPLRSTSERALFSSIEENRRERSWKLSPVLLRRANTHFPKDKNKRKLFEFSSSRFSSLYAKQIQNTMTSLLWYPRNPRYRLHFSMSGLEIPSDLGCFHSPRVLISPRNFQDHRRVFHIL